MKEETTQSIRFWDDRGSLLRQAIAAWLVLLASVLLFTAAAVLLSFITENRALIVTIALAVVSPLSVGALVILQKRDYHLAESKEERKAPVPKRAREPEPAPSLVPNGAYGTLKGKSSATAPTQTLCQLSLKRVPEDLEVTIIAEETRNEVYTVIVEVKTPDDSWPKPDTEVSIKRDKQNLATQITDSSDRAVFERVGAEDLAHLVFEITPGARSDQGPAENSDS